MKDYLASEYAPILKRHGLATFQALWNVQLTAVDEPNAENGGWSSVCRLELEGQGFFLKRQTNYFTRTLHHPLGEPTVAREFRNIMRYRRLGIPSLQAAYYGEYSAGGDHRAVLLTRALDDWSSLFEFLEGWGERQTDEKQAIVDACARLIGRLHAAGLRHGCLYPKHLFLQLRDGQWQGCLIDLEKTRQLWWGWRDQVRDLESFLRTVGVWSATEQRAFVTNYLAEGHFPGSPDLWLQRMARRCKHKEARH